MAILIFMSVYMHLGGGPFWGQLENVVVAPCMKLWKPLLFVDNLVDNGESMCMGWGWYLQNDMQIFFFSLIVLLIYSKNHFAAYIFSLATIIGSFIYSFVVTMTNEYVLVAHLVDFAKWNRYFPDVYIKPWSRCPPYLYGLIMGTFFVQFLARKKRGDDDYIVVRLQQKLKSSKYVKWGLEITGLLIMAFILLIPRTLQVGYVWPQFVESMFLTFSKTGFVVGLSLTITPSLLGVPSKVAFFMDTKFFNFISKVSFWAYLIHYMVLMRTDYLQMTDFYYAPITVFPSYVSHCVGAVFFGFVGTMLVEVPFSKLEKKLFEVFLSKEKRKTYLTESLQTSNTIIEQSLGRSLQELVKTSMTDKLDL